MPVNPQAEDEAIEEIRTIAAHFNAALACIERGDMKGFGDAFGAGYVAMQTTAAAIRQAQNASKVMDRFESIIKNGTDEEVAAAADEIMGLLADRSL